MIKHFFILGIFIFSSHITIAKGIHADFVLRTLPDNAWTLHLKKNNTYTYTHFSGISGLSSTLDSGNYSIENEKIIFSSGMNKEKTFDAKTYYLKKYSIRKGCQINVPGQVFKFESRDFFKENIYLFSYDPIGPIAIFRY